jgi:dienelactone hydrolase
MSAAYGKAPRHRCGPGTSVLPVGLFLLLMTAFLPARAADAVDFYGPFGPEAPRMREQLWIVPSGDPARVLRATVFRPEDPPGQTAPRRPLAVINHGTSESTRVSVSMPVFYWLSRWFVDRGYVVILPQRRGHGATGGTLAEDVGTCSRPAHDLAGRIAADDIEAVVDYMAKQSFVAPSDTVVVGVSTGGWASLALAARNPANVRAVINFAGGRGGHAGGRANAICGKQELIGAAAIYGKSARVPTLWFYARNDSYFNPELATEMATTWNHSGGRAALHILPSYGEEGHDVAEDQTGWSLWGDAVDKFLNDAASVPVAANGRVDPQTTASITPAEPLAGDGQGERERAP